MSTQNYLEHAESLLARWTRQLNQFQPNRIDFDIEPRDLLAAVTSLVDARWGYLAAITGLDPGVDTRKLWVLYHFAEGAAVVTLRVAVSREYPALPTIRKLVPLAAIYEQELSEVLGVTITGAPQAGRLFIPDDWPEGVYPLRKDFQLE